MRLPYPRLRVPRCVSACTDDAELERLTKVGVRGARELLFPGGLVEAGDIPALAARIDHNGKFIEPVATDHPSFRTLLRLLSSGRCWVKASAPYETSKSGPPEYADVGALARTLIQAAPARVVWASNWPHGAVKGTKPDTCGLLRLLEEWAPDARTRARILVDTPAELYGFT
jgi:D-galactarolactone isomerase